MLVNHLILFKSMSDKWELATQKTKVTETIEMRPRLEWAGSTKTDSAKPFKTTTISNLPHNLKIFSIFKALKWLELRTKGREAQLEAVCCLSNLKMKERARMIRKTWTGRDSTMRKRWARRTISSRTMVQETRWRSKKWTCKSKEVVIWNLMEEARITDLCK